MELSNQGKWLLGIILITLATVLFVLGWTAPFWPESFGWLGLPITKTVFPLAVTSLCILLYTYGLACIARTHPPPYSVSKIQIDE